MITIIAEAGVNHNGSVDMARQMIDVASDIGVDYIKFQTFTTERIVSRFATKAEYQRRNLHSNDDSQAAMLRSLELSYDDFRNLRDYCLQSGSKFLSTPFDLAAIDFLADLRLDYMKVPSGEITNLPYLRRVAAIGIPVIMSTGMSTLSEIEAAVRVLTSNGLPIDELTLLHCNTEYPTPMRDVNLKAMDTLRREFGTKVGYSDHTAGIEVAIAAAALGADVIEKHFTLDRDLPGPDHKASLDPTMLRHMVNAIRNVELALGNGRKDVTESERSNRCVARKSIVAATDIRKGDILTADNLTVKRPGTGLSPMLWDEIIGRPAPLDYEPDQILKSSDFGL